MDAECNDSADELSRDNATQWGSKPALAFVGFAAFQDSQPSQSVVRTDPVRTLIQNLLSQVPWQSNSP